jgi:hypothetical protein
VRDGEIVVRPVGHVALTFDHRSAAFATSRGRTPRAAESSGGVARLEGRASAPQIEKILAPHLVPQKAERAVE